MCIRDRLETEYRYLFIGNSLSYSNNLPGILEEVGAFYGVGLEADCLCEPNYALLDHWADNTIPKHLEQKPYDMVLLQQGPSSQPYGREVLLEYGSMIKELATSYNTATSFYMVWPSIAYFGTFDGVIKNYSDAARKTGSLLLPVGKVWRSFLDIDEKQSIYSSDLFHPSKKGSFLAALVIFQTIFPDLDINDIDPSVFSDYVTEREFLQMLSVISSN